MYARVCYQRLQSSRLQRNLYIALAKDSGESLHYVTGCETEGPASLLLCRRQEARLARLSHNYSDLVCLIVGKGRQLC